MSMDNILERFARRCAAAQEDTSELVTVQVTKKELAILGDLAREAASLSLTESAGEWAYVDYAGFPGRRNVDSWNNAYKLANKALVKLAEKLEVYRGNDR